MDQTLSVYKAVRWFEGRYAYKPPREAWLPEYLMDITTGRTDVPSDWIFPNRYCVLKDDSDEDCFSDESRSQLPLNFRTAISRNYRQRSVAGSPHAFSNCVKEA